MNQLVEQSAAASSFTALGVDAGSPAEARDDTDELRDELDEGDAEAAGAAAAGSVTAGVGRAWSAASSIVPHAGGRESATKSSTLYLPRKESHVAEDAEGEVAIVDIGAQIRSLISPAAAARS